MKLRDRILWVALGVVAGAFLVHGLAERHANVLFSWPTLDALEACVGFSLARIDLVVGVVLVVLTCVGFLLRWWPLVPSALLGVCVLELLASLPAEGTAYEVSLAYPRAVRSDVGILLIGMICGGFIGAALDRRRCQAEQPPAARPDTQSASEHSQTKVQ